jgi:hypothetical protein
MRIAERRLLSACIAGLAVWSLTCPCSAAAEPAPGHTIPLADFTLGETWDLIVVGVVCVAVVLLWLLTRAIPGVGTVVLIVITLPIVEEFLFRYLLTGLWGLYYGGVNSVAALVGRLCAFERRDTYVEALVFFGFLFGVLHLFTAMLPWVLDFTKAHAAAVFQCPPGLQVGEGLFIGMFNGFIYIIFIYVYDIGLLATMIYVWMAHILINLVLVAYNLFVNFVIGPGLAGLLAHIAPRLLLAATAIFWFVRCWVSNSLPIEVFQ